MGRLVMNKFNLYVDNTKVMPLLFYSSGAPENMEIIYKNSWVTCGGINWFYKNEVGPPFPSHKLRYARSQGLIDFVMVPRWNSSRGGERFLYRFESFYNLMLEKWTIKERKSIDYILSLAFFNNLPRKGPDFSKVVTNAN
jgi:hypothetical protein